MQSSDRTNQHTVCLNTELHWFLHSVRYGQCTLRAVKAIYGWKGLFPFKSQCLHCLNLYLLPKKKRKLFKNNTGQYLYNNCQFSFYHHNLWHTISYFIQWAIKFNTSISNILSSLINSVWPVWPILQTIFTQLSNRWTNDITQSKYISMSL